MTVKERTAQVLEENRGKYISGADIASELGVTRNAVWKAVNILKKEGYIVNAVTNKGYCLSEKSDILSENSLRKILEPRYAANLKLMSKVTSTNTVLREMAVKGAPEGTIVMSPRQSAGRGRFENRRFYSEEGGVYFSILLKPDVTVQKSLMITTAAAVAAAESVERVSGRKAKIKWVNDVFVDDKKVCGILTEASLRTDGAGLDYAILGIGVNVREPDGGFPEEIKATAGAVLSENADIPDARSRIAGEIINRFFEIYLHPDSSDYVSEYKRRSLVLGKEVYLISVNGDEKREAHVLDIDDECRLVARLDDGNIVTVSSGEVSLKLK